MNNSNSAESRCLDALPEADYVTQCDTLSKMTLGQGAVLFGEPQRHLTAAEKLELTTTVD